MSDKSIFDAIQRRDLSGVLDQMYAYRHAIDCACPECDLRARLSLETRDEQERVGANTWQDRDADEYGVNRTGPI